MFAVKGAYLGWLDGPRWQNEDKLSHELYNAGHLYEAAVAWYEATGNRNLLDIALKNAELIARDFGPGKLAKAPGHQEIEIGLNPKPSKPPVIAAGSIWPSFSSMCAVMARSIPKITKK